MGAADKMVALETQPGRLNSVQGPYPEAPLVRQEQLIMKTCLRTSGLSLLAGLCMALGACATPPDGPSKYAPDVVAPGYYAPAYPYYYYPYYNPAPVIDSVTINPAIVK